MNLYTIILLALGLSMDSFTVAISRGLCLSKVRIKDALKVGILFGFFQGLMPFIGWAIGIKLTSFVSNIDHWIAFIILSIIGIKMLYEAIKDKNDECCCNKRKDNSISFKVLIMLAIATSIDAMAAGLSFAFIKVSIMQTVLIIGSLTFSLSFIGVYLGNRCCKIYKKYAEILGGIVLIFIGLKILLEHTYIIEKLLK